MIFEYIYAVVIPLFLIVIAIFGVLCWGLFHCGVKAWVKSIPGKIMKVIDTIFYQILDELFEKGNFIDDAWKDGT